MNTTFMYRGKASNRRRRGTAFVMMVLVTVILTGLVMTIAWSATVQAQSTGASIHLDQANLAAENAGQIVVWNFKHNNAWRQVTAPTNLPTITVGSATFKYAATCLDAGATATLYWPFSEGTGGVTADASGHNNTGTFYGGVSWTTGRYGNGLQFDGSTGYIDAGSDPSTNITSSLTMAAWVKMNSAAQDQKVGGNEDNVSGGYKMSIYGQKVELEVHDTVNTFSCNRNAAGGTVMATGVWYHLAGVWNSSTGTISTYVNGVFDRSQNGFPSTALAPTFGHFQMGREPWTVGGNNRYFNGTLDDVRIYNRVLSAQEIKTLANTSVKIHTTVTQQGVVANGVIAAADFVCSIPSPLPPVAPALTVGGNLPMNKLTVTGDVQTTGAISVTGTSSVTGKVTYGTNYTDASHLLTVTYKGATTTPTQNASATAPTIDYTNLASQAVSTTAGGSNQNFYFTNQNSGLSLFMVTGDCTDPVIDTSNTGGTLYITGNLTITKNTTWGAAGLPANVVVKGNVIQTGKLTLIGALYVGGNWQHVDSTISGDVCVKGNVTDNSTTGTSIVVGSIPWFDPRNSTAATVVPLFYAAYQGANP